MKDGSVPPDRAPTIRIFAMPDYTNPSGDIFGGWLMSMMDMAGVNVAFERAGGRVATVAVNEIEFHSPVLVGDLVRCNAKVVRTGRASLGTKVEVWVRGRSGGDPIKLTEGEFTFVAINDDRVPRPLQKL